MFEKLIPAQIMLRGLQRRWRQVMINKMIIKFNGIPNKAQMRLPLVKSVFTNTGGFSSEPVAAADVVFMTW